MVGHVDEIINPAFCHVNDLQIPSGCAGNGKHWQAVEKGISALSCQVMQRSNPSDDRERCNPWPKDGRTGFFNSLSSKYTEQVR
jgi:hypothetical protein